MNYPFVFLGSDVTERLELAFSGKASDRFATNKPRGRCRNANLQCETLTFIQPFESLPAGKAFAKRAGLSNEIPSTTQHNAEIPDIEPFYEMGAKQAVLYLRERLHLVAAYPFGGRKCQARIRKTWRPFQREIEYCRVVFNPFIHRTYTLSDMDAF